MKPSPQFSHSTKQAENKVSDLVNKSETPVNESKPQSNLTDEQINHLQQTIGNKAVNKLMKQHVKKPGNSSTPVKQLVNKDTALVAAVKEGKFAVVQEILQNYSDDVTDNYLTSVISYVSNHPNLIDLLLEIIVNRNLLMIVAPKNKVILTFRCIEADREDMLTELLKSGVDLKAKLGMNTILSHAIYEGSIGMVKALIDAGADVNEPGFLDQLPLYEAAGEGKLDLVKLLVMHGAKIDAVSGTDGHSGSALINAALEGHIEVVEYLLSKHANPNLAYLSSNGGNETDTDSDSEQNDEDVDVQDFENSDDGQFDETKEELAVPQITESNGQNDEDTEYPEIPKMQWRTALDAAADRKYTDVVELLLGHPVESRTIVKKLDFTTLNSSNAVTLGTAIRRSVKEGHQNVLKQSKQLISELTWDNEEETASNVAHMLGCLTEQKDAFREFLALVPEQHVVAVGKVYVELHKHAKAKSLEMSLKQFLQENGHGDLVGLFESSDTMYEIENLGDGKVVRKPKIREELLEDKSLKLITTLQKIIGGRHANKKVKKHVGIDLVEASERNAAYGERSAAKDLPDHPELQQLRAEFFKLAQQIPYYMKHALTDPAIYEVIMQDGSLMSQDRVQNVKGIKSKGLNTESDQANQSHYYNYHSTGTIKDKLPTPKSLNSTTNPEFIMNVDDFMEAEPLHAKHLVVKGEDWGAQHERTIDLESGIKIMIKFESGKPEKVHTQDSKIHYTYSDTTSGEIKQYSFNLSDEVAVGRNFKKATASFIMRHFDQLPEKAQLQILEPLKQAKELNIPMEQELKSKQAVADIFQKFYFMEASIGGSLPLDIRYMDTIRKPHDSNQQSENFTMKLAELKKSIIEGDLLAVENFFMEHPEAVKIPFIVKSALDIARNSEKTEIVELLNVMYTNNIVPHKGIAVIPREVTDINLLQKLILENKSEYTTALLSKDELTLKTKLNHNRRADGTHSAAITALAGALGNTHYVDKDSLEMSMDELDPLSDFKVMLDGQEHAPDSPEGHGSFNNVKEVRDALLKHEMETLLTSAQNEDYFIKHGAIHPVTGKGATESSVLNNKNKLQEYSIEVRTIDEDYVQIKVNDQSNEKDKLELVSSTLSQSLNLDKQHCEASGNTLTIKVPVRELLQRMLSAKINYQGVVPFDEDGNMLLAERQGEGRGMMGLSTSGGHNSNNYHPFSGAMTELEEENALKLKKDYPLSNDLMVSRTGTYQDVAVIALPYDAYEPMEEGKKHQQLYNERHHPKKLTVPFKAEESEFALFSEEILAHHEMRGRKFREVMPLEDILRWEQVQLQNQLSKTMFSNIQVSIDSTCKLETLVNNMSYMVKYKVPQAHFGQITFKLTPNSNDDFEIMETLINLLKKATMDLIIVHQDEVSLTVDHLNPLKITEILKRS
jgi:ankyrin repeat protein